MVPNLVQRMVAKDGPALNRAKYAGLRARSELRSGLLGKRTVEGHLREVDSLSVMWPFTHLVIEYLLYTSYAHAHLRRLPSQFAAVLVLLGTQLPDLIDKPLALAGVLSSGRALGHSLLFGLPLIALVGAAVYRPLIHVPGAGGNSPPVEFRHALVVSVTDGVEVGVERPRQRSVERFAVGVVE